MRIPWTSGTVQPPLAGVADGSADKPTDGRCHGPTGTQRSAGSFATARPAERVAIREELKVTDGHWHDTPPGKVTFRDYVETVWLPSRHIT